MGLIAQNLAIAAMEPLVHTSVEDVSAKMDGWAMTAQCQLVLQINLDLDVLRFVPVKNITQKGKMMQICNGK